MLTKILRDHPEVAEKLAALVDPSSVVSHPLPLQAYPRTDHYALVGTAFDYFLRWELERRNEKAKDQEWIATTAVTKSLRIIKEMHGISEPVERLYRAVLEEATEFHAAWMTEKNPSKEMLESAAKVVLCLAKMDPLYRTGTVDPTVNVYDPDDVLDVMTCYSIVPWKVLGAEDGVVPMLNPSFGAISHRFNGADADLIVVEGDPPLGKLVDLKTSKHNGPPWGGIVKHEPQLIGYAMIAEEYRAHEDSSFPALDTAGIYWCRHGYLERFPLSPVYSSPGYQAAKDLLFATADEECAKLSAPPETMLNSFPGSRSPEPW